MSGIILQFSFYLFWKCARVYGLGAAMNTIEKIGRYFELAVLWLSGSIFLAIWLTIGFGLWFVMLMRSIAVVTIVTLGLLLKRRGIDSTVKNLTRIIAIWPEGFKIAINNFFKGEYKQEYKDDKIDSKIWAIILKVIEELFYSILFYGSIYILFFFGIGNFIELIATQFQPASIEQQPAQ